MPTPAPVELKVLRACLTELAAAEQASLDHLSRQGSAQGTVHINGVLEGIGRAWAAAIEASGQAAPHWHDALEELLADQDEDTLTV